MQICFKLRSSKELLGGYKSRISAIFEQYFRYYQSYLVEYEIDKYSVVSTKPQT